MLAGQTVPRHANTRAGDVSISKRHRLRRRQIFVLLIHSLSNIHIWASYSVCCSCFDCLSPSLKKDIFRFQRLSDILKAELHCTDQPKGGAYFYVQTRTNQRRLRRLQSSLTKY